MVIRNAMLTLGIAVMLMCHAGVARSAEEQTKLKETAIDQAGLAGPRRDADGDDCAGQLGKISGTRGLQCPSCREYICCCRPGWQLIGEAMFLRRRSSPATTLATDQNTGLPLLTTSDFDNDYGVVPRLRLIRDGSCCHGWEVDLFGLSSIDSDADTGGAISPLFLGPGFPLPSTAPGTIFRTDYDTTLSSLEVNYRRRLGRNVAVVAGFRWLELSDELDVDQIAPVQRDLFVVDANNHLYGFQVGMDANLWDFGMGFFTTRMRAAVLGNRADQNIDAPIVSPLPGFVDHVQARDRHTAFFGEWGFHAVLPLNQRAALRAGYQLMWLEGVALAPDQIGVNSLVIPAVAAVDTSGSLFLSGATFGLSIAY